MSARGRSRSLEVFVGGAHAGALHISGNGLLSFRYDERYSGPQLSLCMPFSNEEYVGRVVHAWFDNLLPDNDQVRRGMAEKAGSSTGLFPLLSRFGLDLTGAVQTVSPDNLEAFLDRPEGYARLTSDQVGDRLAAIVEAEAANRARSWTLSDEHWSLGGMQTKLALREYRGQWYECLGSSASNVIVKPGAFGLEGQALDECVTMRLAKRCGLPVADVTVEPFGSFDAIVSRRYDRFTDAQGAVTRIHQEDCCQATATVSSCKYTADGGPSAATIIALLENAEGASRQRFIDGLLFNYLTASTDAHAKNYSLLHPARDRFMLAPLYDVASAAPYMKKGKSYRLAMSIGGENRVGWLRASSLERLARTHGIDFAALADRVEELAEQVKENLEVSVNEFSSCEGIDQLASLLVPRLRALCAATQRNIRVGSRQFKPVDITRFGW